MTPEKQSIMISYIVFGVLWYVSHSIGMRKLFQRSGKSAGLAFIPLWREVVLFQLVWQKKNMGLIWLATFVLGNGMYFGGAASKIQFLGWTGLVLIIASVYLWIRKCYKESRAYNTGNGTAAGLIFMNMIFTVCLAFNKNAEYKGAQA